MISACPALAYSKRSQFAGKEQIIVKSGYDFRNNSNIVSSVDVLWSLKWSEALKDVQSLSSVCHVRSIFVIHSLMLVHKIKVKMGY